MVYGGSCIFLHSIKHKEENVKRVTFFYFLFLFLLSPVQASTGVGIKNNDVIIYTDNEGIDPNLCYFVGKPYSPGSLVNMDGDSKHACCKEMTQKQAIWKIVKPNQTIKAACTTYE
jgi:hypothetical protein